MSLEMNVVGICAMVDCANLIKGTEEDWVRLDIMHQDRIGHGTLKFCSPKCAITGLVDFIVSKQGADPWGKDFVAGTDIQVGGVKVSFERGPSPAVRIDDPVKIQPGDTRLKPYADKGFVTTHWFDAGDHRHIDRDHLCHDCGKGLMHHYFVPSWVVMEVSRGG